jgi:hypothetical protein
MSSVVRLRSVLPVRILRPRVAADTEVGLLRWLLGHDDVQCPTRSSRLSRHREVRHGVLNFLSHSGHIPVAFNCRCSAVQVSNDLGLEVLLILISFCPHQSEGVLRDRWAHAVVPGSSPQAVPDHGDVAAHEENADGGGVGAGSEAQQTVALRIVPDEDHQAGTAAHLAATKPLVGVGVGH